MKKFNCPFCNEKFYKDSLIKHIDKEHDDELPLDYTSYRMVYDVVNNKNGHGNCTICGKPTKWNEKRQKYNRLCGDPKCAKKVKEIYQSRMLRVYNKVHLLNDPHQQEKMLASRRISGKYKWSDGKIFTYTGQYEKNLMEFLDKVMNYKSDEIVAPGPTLEYEFKGKKHYWITDFLILPYNLIIEVKDGGNNPNNRFMPEYRGKQIAKEKMITNMGTYSYIRLTNNDFSQLLCILAELKMKVVDDNADTPLYRIHEDVFTIYGAINEASKIDTLIYSYRENLNRVLEQYSYDFDIEPMESTIETVNEDTMNILYMISPSRNLSRLDIDRYFHDINKLTEELQILSDDRYEYVLEKVDMDNDIGINLYLGLVERDMD